MHAIDLQLRERNTVTLYHGTTRPLIGRIHGGIDFEADPAYRKWCGVAAGQLLKAWNVPLPYDLQRSVAQYLRHAVGALAQQRSFHFSKEGYWQNRLALAWGRSWSNADPFLIFDREVVLGFVNGDARDRYFAPLATPYHEAAVAIRGSVGQGWAKRSVSEHRELDFLAVDAEGTLVCIELKHGSNADGIYWGPLQVGQYRDALAAALPHVRSFFRSLIEQKIELGLLPPDALTRLPSKAFEKVTGVLLVAEPPSSRSKVWSRLGAMQEQLGTRRVGVFLVDDTEGGLTLREWKP